MGLFGGGGGSESFIQGSLIFGFMVLFLMPTFISVFMESPTDELGTYASEDTVNNLLESYNNFTNNSSMKEQPWALTGIYTPYLGGSYHYSSDGWLYGTLVTSYSPSQYKNLPGKYKVVQGMDGVENYSLANTDYTNMTGKVYTYQVSDNGTTYDGHKNGDAYTYVTMDVEKQSDIFFTDQLKKEDPNNGRFYYEYSGYRYCWQPLQDGYTQYTDADGNIGTTKINATTSSLSLIWYNVVGNSGISGQLIISGSDQGVAYLTSADIIKAFNSTNNTARFEMQFNGVPMIIYLRIDPSMTYEGHSIEECYNKGWWSIMVASYSTDPVDYYSSSYAISPEKIWETTISLLTFNLDDYDMSPTMRTVASVVFSGVLLTMILAIGLANPKVLLIAAIAGLIALVMDFLGGFTWPPDLSGIMPSIDTPEWWPW